jgi:hypothetical protein
MPLLRWFASVVRSSIWLVVNVAIAAVAFGASAAMFAQTDEDMRVPATILRTVGAFWLYIGVWTWLVRGVLMRPPAPARAKSARPTGAEAARGAAGCFGNLIAVGLTWLIVGGVADAAWAGYQSGNPSDPARRLVDRGLALLTDVAARPEAYLPWMLGGLVTLLVLNAVLARVVNQPSGNARPAASKKKPARQGKQSTPPAGSAPAQIQTRAGAAIEQAHGGAHRGMARGGSREDPVLGTLRYAPSDNGWWARQGGEPFPIRLEADEEGPSTVQLDLARAVVQRAFEAQLRGSDAARTAAQARGVGLPRFTIVTASVGADDGPATSVTLHLRCEGDERHQYSVRSANALHSFSLE